MAENSQALDVYSTDSPSRKVLLVERNSTPYGIELVNLKKSGKQAPTDIVELAKEIAKADTFVAATTCSKILTISKQIQFLRDEAFKIMTKAQKDIELNNMACNFKKVPGKIYYLYERETGQKYLSMLSPKEWGSNQPHHFIEGYRFESDCSWTPENEISSQDSILQRLQIEFNSNFNNLLPLPHS